MKALIDFDDAPVFAVAAMDGFGDVSVREGMLLEGPQGWGEFSPPSGCDDAEVARWLTAAIEPGTVGWPDPVRGRVPVAVAIRSVDPGLAYEMAATAGCRAADVEIGLGSLSEDIARLEAVRDALGPAGSVRATANGTWDTEAAVASVSELSKAAGGLDYVAAPRQSIEDSAALRRKIDVPIAVDLSTAHIRTAPRASLADAVDIAMLKCGPLGGVRRALRVAQESGLPCVVSSAFGTSVGLAADLALAGVLTDLPYACGLGTTSLARGDLVAAGRSLIPVDGHLPVSPMPPAPDRALLARYALTDPGRVAWWRERLHTARVRYGA